MIIQFLLLVTFAAAVFVTWKRAKESAISRREAFGWTILWVGAAVIIVLPQTTTVVAHIVGIGRGVDLVMYASVVVLFALVFRVFVAIDRMERKLTDLVRHQALSQLPPDDTKL